MPFDLDVPAVNLRAIHARASRLEALARRRRGVSGLTAAGLAIALAALLAGAHAQPSNAHAPIPVAATPAPTIT